MVHKLFISWLFLIILGFSLLPKAHAASYTAVQSGNWNDPATWGGSIPTPTDSVTIPVGIAVSIPVGLSVSRSQPTTIEGTLNNNTNGILINDSGAVITNNGVFLDYGTFTNNGTVNNYGTLSVNGTITNEASGVLTNFSTGSIGIVGILNNYGAITNDNTLTINVAGSFANFNSGTLTNKGSLTVHGILTNNNTLNNFTTTNNNGTLNNNDTFNNYCGGVITGNPMNGYPAIDIPRAPAPNLALPSHRSHTTDTTPAFTWNSVSGVQSYRLMVYVEDRSFEYKKRVFVTNYTLTNAEALTPMKYLWRVRTQDVNCSTWSTWSGRNTLFVD